MWTRAREGTAPPAIAVAFGSNRNDVSRPLKGVVVPAPVHHRFDAQHGGACDPADQQGGTTAAVDDRAEARCGNGERTHQGQRAEADDHREGASTKWQDEVGGEREQYGGGVEGKREQVSEAAGSAAGLSVFFGVQA